jgi:hypothetical protein
MYGLSNIHNVIAKEILSLNEASAQHKLSIAKISTAVQSKSTCTGEVIG